MIRTGEWTGGQYGNLGPSGAISAAEYALKRLREIGVIFPADHRLARARRLLIRVNEGGVRLDEENHEILRHVTEAQWTVFDLYLIARAIGRHSSQEQVEKITLSLGGADLPEADRNHLARNTTFELVVAAILTMGGVPVTLAEPDLRIVLQNREIGVAAKRVQGAGAVRRRMREATRQIARSELPGMVAVNADVILMGTKPSEDAVTKGRTIDEELVEIHRADDHLVGDRNVVGRIAFGRTAHWSFGADGPSVSHDMFRQYRIYDRTGTESEGLMAAFQDVEDLISTRMQRL